MSQNTKPKQQLKKVIKETNEGKLVSLVQGDDVETTLRKAEKLGLGSVLDDLQDPSWSRRR